MILLPQMLRMTGQRDRRQERLATSTEMERSRVLVTFAWEETIDLFDKVLGNQQVQHMDTLVTADMR